LTQERKEKKRNKMENKFKRSIILDPAHGENVAGKCAPDLSHYEWKWSREILYKVKDNLEKIGVTVHLSNPKPTEIGLIARRNFMNSIPFPSFVLSLHSNAAGMGDKWMNARNASIWTTRGVTNSDKYATMVQQKLEKDIPEMKWRKDIQDGDVDYEENFTVLTSKHISVLVEWGFQDNKEDLALIKDETIKAKLVQSLTEVLTEISQI
jgi:N-acetylmuramoyl-L-alanine amidase